MFGMRSKTFRAFCRGTVTRGVTAWFGSCTSIKVVQRVMQKAQSISGCGLPSIQNLYNRQFVSNRRRVITDPSHPSHTLDIDRCDLESKANNTEHHTDENGVDRLIVRRGRPFTIVLHLRQSFQPQPGKAPTLTVQTGPLPSSESGTRVTFTVSDAIDKSSWSATMSAKDEKTLSLTISSPADAPIGKYNLLMGQINAVSLAEFIMLFNPWCRRDAVYMENEEERNEYVLCQDGVIFRGTPPRFQELPWTFGQFEPGILDICLRILDENPKFIHDADQDCSARRNPVYVSRVLSAMINSYDDRGVLMGNWSGDYTGGVKPTFWTGSSDILRQWNDSEFKPVRYGQCWVFAAVACAVSRALGIPCRVVTNYGSAHDTDSNLVIEYLFDENSEDIGDDSIWNFHVWIDSWMARPDLKEGFGGWQASDPTPQERSDGVFCCGPVPVSGIKEGELTLKYDAPFVYAEVNADVVTLVRLKNGNTVKISGDTTEVGHHISTKAVGKDERHDITNLYKYPEGSEEERKVFEKAQHHNKLLKTDEEPGVHIKIKIAKSTMIGTDFDVLAIVRNNSPIPKTFLLMFYARVLHYNGRIGDTCGFTDVPELKVEPFQEISSPLRVEYSLYGPSITDERLIKLKVLLIESESRQFHKEVKTIVLDSPNIVINIVGIPRVNQKLTADITLPNPLPVPLHECAFSIKGIHLTDGQDIVHKIGTVAPKQFATTKLEFVPSSPGTNKLIVAFNSDKLGNISAYETIVIKD
ncbi:protein-glutamine gamma-glutamyltransferase 2a isoform X1 [Alosa sapidissima]|uniref:protein-glutamine gamma-glutamyltransferase 2a isoform X1 n=1 Tax=Alosa sapidissima TaxID=34773 RepID=UPI001C0A6420|nr:protein-glutamine gamma-glutamyltransferase 2a isoform X1 [Alosa sapidissima]